MAGAVLFAELPGAAFLIAGLLILGGAMIATPARRKAATFAANRLG